MDGQCSVGISEINSSQQSLTYIYAAVTSLKLLTYIGRQTECPTNTQSDTVPGTAVCRIPISIWQILQCLQKPCHQYYHELAKNGQSSGVHMHYSPNPFYHW